MKYFLFIVFSFFIFLSQKAICQQKEYRDISYIKITDTVLIKYINKEVERHVNNKDPGNVFKKGFGYVGLYVEEYPMNRKDTIIHYSMAVSTSRIANNASNFAYPDYYSFVNKRLVLINLAVLRQLGATIYSKRSKEHIRTLINGCIEKPGPIDSYTYYTGTSVFVLKDKSPIVRIDQ